MWASHYPRCPKCNSIIYWMIVKTEGNTLPYFYREKDSRVHDLLDEVGIKEIRCPECYALLPIKDLYKLRKFVEEGEKKLLI